MLSNLTTGQVDYTVHNMINGFAGGYCGTHASTTIPGTSAIESPMAVAAQMVHTQDVNRDIFRIRKFKFLSWH